MELKDVILSTLAEMEDDTQNRQHSSAEEIKNGFVSKQEESELVYLNSIRERLLVLFEGFQAPNSVNIEAKIDMTLNFLEYTLATIDARVEKLEKGNA